MASRVARKQDDFSCGDCRRDSCSPCSVRKTMAWRAANPEKFRAQQERTRARLRGNRDHLLRTRHGITLADYQSRSASQDGCCAACQRPDSECERGLLHVDHDHATGEVRGLLCPQCNKALGLVADSTDTLLNLATYLMTHQKETCSWPVR